MARSRQFQRLALFNLIGGFAAAAASVQPTIERDRHGEIEP
jgi:hypothetical protein